MSFDEDVLARAARVRLLLMDVDGVMTDAKIYNVPGPDGKIFETKGFDAQDGIALQWLLDPGAFDLEASGDLAVEMLMRSLEPCA